MRCNICENSEDCIMCKSCRKKMLEAILALPVNCKLSDKAFPLVKQVYVGEIGSHNIGSPEEEEK